MSIEISNRGQEVIDYLNLFMATTDEPERKVFLFSILIFILVYALFRFIKYVLMLIINLLIPTLERWFGLGQAVISKIPNVAINVSSMVLVIICLPFVATFKVVKYILIKVISFTDVIVKGRRLNKIKHDVEVAMIVEEIKNRQETGGESRYIAINELSVPTAYYNYAILNDMEQVKKAALTLKKQSDAHKDFSWPRLLAWTIYGGWRHECEQYQLGNPVVQNQLEDLGISSEIIFSELNRNPSDFL